MSIDMQAPKIAKKEFRRQALQARGALTEVQAEGKSALILDRLLHFEPFLQAQTVMSFMSFGTEVRTRRLAQYALDQGKTLLLPVPLKGTRQMSASQVLDLEKDLFPGLYGILTPRTEALRPVDPAQIDFILIPGVAFSEDCYRLGYGGGYYDTFIGRLREDAAQCAVAFEEQIYPSVPRELHDRQIPMVITDERVLRP